MVERGSDFLSNDITEEQRGKVPEFALSRSRHAIAALKQAEESY
jgi:hypothetical protein